MTQTDTVNACVTKETESSVLSAFWNKGWGPDHNGLSHLASSLLLPDFQRLRLHYYPLRGGWLCLGLAWTNNRQMIDAKNQQSGGDSLPWEIIKPGFSPHSISLELKTARKNKQTDKKPQVWKPGMFSLLSSIVRALGITTSYNN